MSDFTVTDETKEQTAERLIQRDVRALLLQTKKTRKRLAAYARSLSPANRKLLLDYLRRDFDQTLAAAEEVQHETPEFSFMPGSEWE